MQREECLVPAKVTRVRMRLEDGLGHVSPEFEAPVAFAAVKPLTPLLDTLECLERFELTWKGEEGSISIDYNG
jgi:hypothetical protein